MISFRILALGALLLATPAWAEGWRVESVSGDAVSVKGGDPQPLEAGDVVDEGATVVSGPQTALKLGRRGDVVSLDADTMVELRPGGGARAIVDAKSGQIEVKSVPSDEGALQVVTRFFRIDAQAARFTVKARKDFATVDVDAGMVDVQDTQHAGAPVALAAGGTFRGSPAAKAPDAAKDDKAAQQKAAGKADDAADAEAAKRLDQLDVKPKKGAGKKNSELMMKLAQKGGAATKEGLDELADEYDADAPPPETPRIGLLRFLFGPDAPSLGTILGVIGVTFGIFGYVTSLALGEVGLGMFGNAFILLIGAFLGAGLHDLAFSPNFFWEYEPTAGIFTTVAGALAALIGACFARKYIEERMDEAAATASVKSAANGGRRRS